MKHISSSILEDLNQETVVSGDEVIRDRNLSASKRIDIHYMRLRQIANEREPEGGETVEQILADLKIIYDERLSRGKYVLRTSQNAFTPLAS